MTSNELIGFARTLDRVLFTNGGMWVVNTTLIPITSEQDFESYHSRLITGIEIISPVEIRVMEGSFPKVGDTIKVSSYPPTDPTTKLPPNDPDIIGVATLLEGVCGCSEETVSACGPTFVVVTQFPLFDRDTVEYAASKQHPTICWDPETSQIKTPDGRQQTVTRGTIISVSAR